VVIEVGWVVKDLVSIVASTTVIEVDFFSQAEASFANKTVQIYDCA